MMHQRATLRTQLALAYSIALILGLVAFGSIAIAILDATARSALDQTLLAATHSVRALVEVRNGDVRFDETDRSQLAHVIGVKLGGVVYDAGGRVEIASTQAIPQGVRANARSVRTGTRFATIGKPGALLRVLAVPVRQGGHVAGVIVLWGPVDYIEDLDRHSAIVFAIAIPFITGFGMLVGNMVAGRGLLLLRRMAELTSEIEAHDLSRRLDDPGTNDELGRLCATFNRMLDRLQAAFERERRFTADASHELRGPLSVMKVESELALRRPRERTEYQRTLRVIAVEIDHLEALTAGLLSSARASETAASLEAVNLSEVLESVRTRLAPLTLNSAVSVTIDCNASRYVRSTPGGAARVLFAVLHNALKYSPPGGCISVMCTDERDVTSVEISDDGPGFGAQALTRAFERFWRDAGEEEREGTGLGLAIAQSIMRSCGGTIRLRNRVRATGAVVTVVFPRA